MANNTIIISFGCDVNAVMKTGKHRSNDDDELHWWRWVGGKKRCEKLFAAMKPFCLNQIENIYILCSCWLFEVSCKRMLGGFSMGKESQEAKWKCTQSMGMESECFWILIIMAGGAFNTLTFSQQFYMCKKRNWGCAFVTCVTFLFIKEAPLHLHYDCVKSKHRFVHGSQFLNYSQLGCKWSEWIDRTTSHTAFSRDAPSTTASYTTITITTNNQPTNISNTMNSGKVNFLFAFCTSTAYYFVLNSRPKRKANL